MAHDDGALDLTVVVPYFNTGPRVRSTVDELVDALAATGRSFEVIAVSDGSTDSSDASLVGTDPAIVRTVRFAANRGKGEALRAGFAMGQGRWIGFIDGDGDLPPAQMALLVDAALGGPGPPDVVLGSKLHPGSDVVFSPMRRLASWAWRQLVTVAFSLHVSDTQCGVKLARREVLDAVVPLTVARRFAFDLELLVVARHLGFRRFVEVPVRTRQRAGSTVSAGAALGMVRDLGAIWWRLRVRRAYDLPNRS